MSLYDMLSDYITEKEKIIIEREYKLNKILK